MICLNDRVLVREVDETERVREEERRVSVVGGGTLAA